MSGGPSKYFIEGYEASKRGIIRMRNPYAIGQPWLSEDPTKAIPYQEWQQGWMSQFHGEPIVSDPQGPEQL